MTYATARKQIFDLLDSVPHSDTFRGNASDEYMAKLVDNTDQIQPFFTVGFGGRTEPARRVNGIVGARHDSFTVVFVVHSVANTEDNAQNLSDAGWDKLIGFVPEGCGEIRPALFGGIGEVSVMGNPTRLSAVQSYTMLVNSDSPL